MVEEFLKLLVTAAIRVKALKDLVAAMDAKGIDNDFVKKENLTGFWETYSVDDVKAMVATLRAMNDAAEKADPGRVNNSKWVPLPAA